jgi:coenzyme PQQ precursor peptide PqqA
MTDPSLEDATPPAVAGVDAGRAAPATSGGLTPPRRKWIPPVVEMVPTGLEVTAYIAAE